MIEMGKGKQKSLFGGEADRFEMAASRQACDAMNTLEVAEKRMSGTKFSWQTGLKGFK